MVSLDDLSSKIISFILRHEPNVIKTSSVKKVLRYAIQVQKTKSTPAIRSTLQKVFNVNCCGYK